MSDPIETPTPSAIRAALADSPKLRSRDLANQLNISEAQLLAAQTGRDVTRISADPDLLMPATETLGEVMALTRVEAAVHEKVGHYANYHSGPHASMVLNEAIDLRIFPKHWVHGFLVEQESDHGPRRSLQVFDAAGDAVHKIHLREGSNLAGWTALKETLATGDSSGRLEVRPREPVEAAKSDPSKLEILRKEWARLTDTHQFLRLCSKLKMNRLGAYRISGAPFVRALNPMAVDTMLEAARDRETGIMLFVGNRGCIQIHSGPIHSLKPIGPWQNIMDPGFNLHLRRDKVAELWAVEKPTQRGPAISVEGFDAEGGLIFQCFGIGKEGNDHRPAWREIVEALPDSEQVPA